MSALQGKLGERAVFDEPMRGHTTWKAGGPAWAMCRVTTAEEAAFVTHAAEAAGKGWMCLGLGSNLLVADSGYAGVMLRLAGELAGVHREGQSLVAGGGASLAACDKLAASEGLAGLEWAAGIPGTVGGAVAMNAGAHGARMSDITGTVTLLLPGGRVQEVDGGDLPAAYRRRDLPAGSLVLAARLDLTPGDCSEISRRRKEVLALRKSSQPLSAATAGSVFKNPAGDFAGRLIEAAGCKGLAVGDAVVSRRHANFIENQGAASAADIAALMILVAERVRQDFGVELEPEVRLVGDV